MIVPPPKQELEIMSKKKNHPIQDYLQVIKHAFSKDKPTKFESFPNEENFDTWINNIDCYNGRIPLVFSTKIKPSKYCSFVFAELIWCNHQEYPSHYFSYDPTRNPTIVCGSKLKKNMDISFVLKMFNRITTKVDIIKFNNYNELLNMFAAHQKGTPTNPNTITLWILKDSHNQEGHKAFQIPFQYAREFILTNKKEPTHKLQGLYDEDENNLTENYLLEKGIYDGETDDPNLNFYNSVLLRFGQTPIPLDNIKTIIPQLTARTAVSTIKYFKKQLSEQKVNQQCALNMIQKPL